MRLHEGDVITFGGPKLVQSTIDMLAPQCSNPHTYTACGLQSLLPASSAPAQDETQQLMPPDKDTLPGCSAPEDNAQHVSALCASTAAHAQSAMLPQMSCAAEGLQQTCQQGEGSSLEHSAEQGASGIVNYSLADAGLQLEAPAVEAELSAEASAAARSGPPAAEGSASPAAGGADPDDHAAEHASAATALAPAPSNLPDAAQDVTEDKAPPEMVESAAPPDAQAAAGTHAAAGSMEDASCPASVATAAAVCCDSVIDLTAVSSL